MLLACYTPPDLYIRVYLPAPKGVVPKDADKDVIWGAYKESRGIEPGEEQFYFGDDEEHAAERAKFFAGWDDPECWDAPAPVFVDTHY